MKTYFLKFSKFGLAVFFICLFLYVIFYWWPNSENIPSVLFDGFSKSSIIKAVFTFLLNDGAWLLILWFGEFFFCAITLLLFMLFYVTSYKTEIFYKKFFEFYAPMPFLHKMALFSFSVSFAIPVRIWIKTSLSRIVTFFICFFFVYLVIVFPLLAFFVFFQAVLTINSLVFAFTYENSQLFQKFVCKTLFAGNQAFALCYFEFFWGNMKLVSLRRFREVVVALFGNCIFYLFRQKHVEKAEQKGIEEANAVLAQSGTSMTPQQIIDLREKAVKNAKANEPILSLEEALKDMFSAISRWVFGP